MSQDGALISPQTEELVRHHPLLRSTPPVPVPSHVPRESRVNLLALALIFAASAAHRDDTENARVALKGSRQSDSKHFPRATPQGLRQMLQLALCATR